MPTIECLEHKKIFDHELVSTRPEVPIGGQDVSMRPSNLPNDNKADNNNGSIIEKSMTVSFFKFFLSLKNFDCLVFGLLW